VDYTYLNLIKAFSPFPHLNTALSQIQISYWRIRRKLVLQEEKNRINKRMKAKIGNFKHSLILTKIIRAYPLETIAKYSTTRPMFNSLLGVWQCGQTRTDVCDIQVLILQQPQLDKIYSYSV